MQTNECRGQPVGQFEGYVDGEPLMKWHDRTRMPQPGDQLYANAGRTALDVAAGPAAALTDLDALEALARAVPPIHTLADVAPALAAMKALHEACAPGAILALISRARAAQRQTSAASVLADGRQWIVLDGQRIGRTHLVDLQQDAARYRWLRDKADGMVCTAAPMVASLDSAGRMVGLLDGEELDDAVDAMLGTPQRRAVANK